MKLDKTVSKNPQKHVAVFSKCVSTQGLIDEVPKYRLTIFHLRLSGTSNQSEETETTRTFAQKKSKGNVLLIIPGYLIISNDDKSTDANFINSWVSSTAMREAPNKLNNLPLQLRYVFDMKDPRASTTIILPRNLAQRADFVSDFIQCEP